MTEKYSLERELAPHVDPQWAEWFLVTLRLQEVPGDRIGAALAEVEAHVAESGETAEEAFGEPVAYARSLGLKANPAGTKGQLLRNLLVVPSLLGLDLVVESLQGLSDGVFPVRTGLLVTLGLYCLILVTLAAAGGALVDLLVRRRGAAVAVYAAAAALLVVPVVLWRGAAFTLPAWPALLAGVVLVVAMIPVNYRLMAGSADPVTPPLPSPDDPDGSVAAARAARSNRRAAWAFALMFPVVTALLAGVWLVLG